MHEKFITVFLGGSIALRRLNEEQSVTIIKHYSDKRFSIALLGGKDVELFAQDIASKINSPKILNYAGKLSLMQSAALIQRSSLFIGHGFRAYAFSLCPQCACHWYLWPRQLI